MNDDMWEEISTQELERRFKEPKLMVGFKKMLWFNCGLILLFTLIYVLTK